MYSFAISLVICSGILHALWNYLTKISTNKNVFLWCISIVAAIALLPLLVMEWIRTDIPPRGYALIAASMTLQGGYALLMSHAYKHGDMSQIYPVMRGTAVVFVPFVGVLFLGERLSLWGWTGVVFIIIGIVIMNIGIEPFSRSQTGILFAFAVGLVITAYSIIDKLLLSYLSPLALLQLSNMGFALVLIPSVFKTKGWVRDIRDNRKLLLFGAVFSPGSYFLYLLALNIAPISHLAPLRESGTVFGVLLGIVILKEKYALQRMTAVAILAAGILVFGFTS